MSTQPDPFEALRAPVIPVAPDPAFAGRLRSRLERALDLPRGVAVTTTAAAVHAPTTEVSIAASAITPYLAVAGAARAIEWYAEAFGARVVFDPITMPDGRVGHAEIQIGNARLMLADEFPDIGHVAPRAGEGAQVTLHLDVADVDAVIARAVSAGATLVNPAEDYAYGRHGTITDPFGHRWLVSREPAAAAAVPVEVAPRHGDIGYVSLWVPDVDRAATFFADVLGWSYAPAAVPQGRRVEGLSLHHGMWGEQDRSTLFCCFAVDDVDTAIDRVRASGGTAGEPTEEPYGRIAECTDDQGGQFAVYTPVGGIGHGDRAPQTSAAGDLIYVTLTVPDSAKTREFYGAVLGWTYRGGHVADGWQVTDAVPLVGISGGHEVMTGIPQYAVDDLAATVARVRALGGTATDPERQPYGISALCADDQGTRFYLAQF